MDWSVVSGKSKAGLCAHPGQHAKVQNDVTRSMSYVLGGKGRKTCLSMHGGEGLERWTQDMCESKDGKESFQFDLGAVIGNVGKSCLRRAAGRELAPEG